MLPFDAFSARTSCPARPSTGWGVPEPLAMNTPSLVPISSVIVTLPSPRRAQPLAPRPDELSPSAAQSTIDPTVHYPPAAAACQAGLRRTPIGMRDAVVHWRHGRAEA